MNADADYNVNVQNMGVKRNAASAEALLQSCQSVSPGQQRCISTLIVLLFADCGRDTRCCFGRSSAAVLQRLPMFVNQGQKG